MLRKIKDIPEWLIGVAILIYYFVLSLYKFMQTPLWGDEIAEYYCSVPWKGAIHGITEWTTMYERMANIQQQPPLYNWVMCIWVSISNGEFWIRFSSVAFCIGTVVGLYFVMRKLSNRWMAAVSTVVFISMYQFQYYVKEAAEYALLLPLLFWTIYTFICILEKITWKRIVIFTVLCVAGVYTQYGAAFMIVPMALQVLYRCIRSQEWKMAKVAIGSYMIAVLGAGIPLIILFLIPQSTNPVSTLVLENTVEFEKNAIYDFFFGFVRLLDWQMFDYDRDGARMMPIVWVMAIGFILTGIVVVIKKNNRVLSYLLCSCLGTYILYYVCLKIKLYSYGWFGTRYCLFFMPLIFVTIMYMLWIILQSVKELPWTCSNKMQNLARVMLVMVAVLYCCYGIYRVHNHWWKSDERAVVAYWYENDCKDELTFVDYKQRLTFVYYFELNEAFDISDWDSIYVNMNRDSVDYTVNEWEEYLRNEVWAEGMPDSLYVSTGYYTPLIQALENMGYTAETVIDYTSDLFYLTKSAE